MALVLLRDRDHEPQVRVDEQVLRALVATLDRLRELHLLRRGEQWVAPRLVQEELQRVGRRRGDLLVRVRDLFLDRTRAVVGQLDALRLEALEEAVDVVLLQLELLDELVQLGHVHAAVLLAVLDQNSHRILCHCQTGTPRPLGFNVLTRNRPYWFQGILTWQVIRPQTAQ